MITLPVVHMIDASLTVICKVTYWQIKPDNGRFYPNGIVTESSGMLYLDLNTEVGNMTFVFSTIEKVFSFLLAHGESGDFTDIR